MNEDILWALKIIFILFCLWYVGGGMVRFKQEILAETNKPTIKQNSATVYQPKVYYQTVILK